MCNGAAVHIVLCVVWQGELPGCACLPTTDIVNLHLPAPLLHLPPVVSVNNLRMIWKVLPMTSLHRAQKNGTTSPRWRLSLITFPPNKIQGFQFLCQ